MGAKLKQGEWGIIQNMNYKLFFSKKNIALCLSSTVASEFSDFCQSVGYLLLHTQAQNIANPAKVLVIYYFKLTLRILWILQKCWLSATSHSGSEYCESCQNSSKITFVYICKNLRNCITVWKHFTFPRIAGNHVLCRRHGIIE